MSLSKDNTITTINPFSEKVLRVKKQVSLLIRCF